MPKVYLATEAKAWLDANCVAQERADVMDLLEDLRRPTGLNKQDADLIKLPPAESVGSGLANVRVACYIVPLRVSAAFRLGRTIWLGFLETIGGPARYVGRLDLVLVWDQDPKVMRLVDARAAMLAIANLMYP